MEQSNATNTGFKASNKFRAVTASDTTLVDARAVYVGTGGNLVCEDADGVETTFAVADGAIYQHNMKLHPTDGRAALEIPTADEWPESDRANLVESLSADWTPQEDLP